MGWLPRLLAERGQDLLRTKGILSLGGRDKGFVVQAVHMLMEGNFTTSWDSNEKRDSRLVFIGRNLDELRLRQELEACIA